MKNLFIAISALVAVVPGAAVIKSGLGVPPGYNVLFGGVIEAFGALAFLLLSVNRNKVRRWSNKRITRLATILGIAVFVFIALYILILRFCVVEDPLRGTAYYPLWTTGEISEMITSAGSRRAAINKYGIDAITEAIDEMPDVAVAVTTVLFMFVYQAIFTTLTVVFGLLGFHEGHDASGG